MLLLDGFLLLLSYQKDIHNSAQNWCFTGKWENKKWPVSRGQTQKALKANMDFYEKTEKLKSRMQVWSK